MGNQWTPKRACKWPGCLTLAVGVNGSYMGYCKHHHHKWRWQAHSSREYWAGRKNKRATHRSQVLNRWLASANWKAKTEGTPLTPAQEIIKQRELTRLIRDNPPKNQIALARLNSLAAKYARHGGRDKFKRYAQKMFIQSGTYRMWLRTGFYDPATLDHSLLHLRNLYPRYWVRRQLRLEAKRRREGS